MSAGPLRAMVNENFLIAIGLALIVGTFAARQARRYLGEEYEAKDRGVSLGLVSLFAFIPVPIYFLGRLAGNEILLAFLLLKLIAFIYVLALFLRFFIFKEEQVFAKAVNFFQLSVRGSTSAQEPESSAEEESPSVANSSGSYAKDRRSPH